MGPASIQQVLPFNVIRFAAGMCITCSRQSHRHSNRSALLIAAHERVVWALASPGGLVTRRPDPADKRRIWLDLTAEGKRAVTSVVEDLTARLAPVVDCTLAL